MAEYLVIRLGEQSPQLASWIAADSNGTRLGRPAQGPLEQAAVEVRNRAVIALVPAADALTTSVLIPVRGASRLLATLPFALEDQLAEDVENLHFAAGSKREDGRVPVSVIAHERMQHWLGMLGDAGIEPAMVVPETYGLARIQGTVSLLVAEGQVIFNDGASTEFAMQGVKPSDALAASGALSETTTDAADDNDEPAPHLLVYCEPEDEQRFQHDWLALRNELPGVDINLLPDGVLPRLAVTVATGSGINLLQGAYGPKTEYRRMFRPWRGAAVLLLGLLLVLFATKAVDYLRLSREQADLRAQFTSLYQEIRPGDDREIIDPVATVNSLRRGLGAGSGPRVFLSALQELGLALEQNAEVSVEAISYRAGVIDIRVNAPDVRSLDAIQQAVKAGGRYQASIQSTDQVGDRVNSRIQVREN